MAVGMPNTSSIPANNTAVEGETTDSIAISFKIIKLVIAIVVTLLIICNNLINMIVLRKMRDINRRMKILLFSLSISDFCLGVMVCIPAVVSGILGYWPFSAVACQLTGTMNGVAIAVSLWSLTAISIERSVLMRKVVVARKDKVILPIIIGVIFIWVFNIAFFAFPIFLEDDYVYYKYDPEVMSCSFRWKSSIYFILAKLLYPILSGIVILISSIRIHFILRQAQSIRRNMPSKIEISDHGSTYISKSPSSQARVRTKKIKNVSGTHNGTHESVTVLRNNNGTISHNDHSNVYLGPTLATSDSPAIPSNSMIASSTSHACPDQQQQQQQQQDASQNLWKNRISSTEMVSRNEDTRPANFMPRSVLRRNTKSRRLLVCTSALFFITTTPYMASSLVDHFLVGWEMPHVMKFTALWILNTNSFINVYVYSVIYSEFRNHCRKLFNVFECACRASAKSHAPKLRIRSAPGTRKRATPMTMPKGSTQGESSVTNYLDDEQYLRDHRGHNKGYSFDDGTSCNGDQPKDGLNTHLTPKSSLVLIPRNDAGVPCKLPLASQSSTSGHYVSANNTSALMRINSVQLNMLPSIEI